MKKWQLKEINSANAASFSQETGLCQLVSHVLAGRGITTRQQADEFFNAFEFSDPMLLEDMEKAVSAIQKALESGTKITIYGDYDCDGVTSTVMLYSYLTALGGECDWYIPSRDEGYGLNLLAIDKLYENGTRMIITVDNGISAHDEAEYIREKGIKLVITDHHQAPETIPTAEAVVNPNRRDDFSPCKRLAGCGVVLKLITAMEGDPDGVLEQYGDLAAIGTVGDIVPLIGENRHIVERGLQNIRCTENIGLLKLVKAAGLGDRPVTSTSLAFSICPRINAAGRFAHPKEAAELFLCENAELAEAKAKELCELNVKRQNAENEIFTAIEAMLAENPIIACRRVIVVSGDNWNHGIIGIVSARLLSKYGKPSIVITKEGEYARGSARSIEGFSLFKLLEKCSDLLTRFGGHARAAGFTIETARIEEFSARVNEIAAAKYALMPVETIVADKELDSGELTVENVEQLSILQPFGEENAQPMFIMRGCVIKSKKPLKDGKYLSFTVDFKGEEYRILDFSSTFDGFIYGVGDNVDMLVTAEINEYNNKKSVAVRMRDMRLSCVNQDKYFAARGTYDSIRCGEKIDPRLLKRVIPEKNDIKTAYDLLRRFNDNAQLEQEAMRAGLNYCMFRVILDVFSEFGLTQTDYINGRVTLVPSPQKAELAKSALLSELRSRMGENA